MSKIIFDSGISLDGFFAGDNRGPENPMGGVSAKIHSWMFNQKAFWAYLGVEGGKEDTLDGTYIRETIARTGAFIMGKRMFEEGEASWPNDLYKADVYVLTHEVREPWVQEGSTTFYFINDGIESALDKAIKSAKGKDVRIQGGANTIQQFLNAGLVDEFFIHIAPVFLGSGIRLFEGIDKDIYDIKIMEVLPSDFTTHLRYKLTKKSASPTK
ncbi:dihydrofolate reductase family protein [Sphingobacterium psychroaquaticum]|uniref:RibD C-terminal domain-containing protein n=1 Tax=Sphingobacterium psychroaquaticum TaxID=561061 RepID=A0A1X7IE18_9SPHI|nr:dihydrofolate reductase family protein [Sphingobacterium psychroaquaticum]SMG12801.1 RibD C-terminal domain-containing protein [Sphingobacterium psychroaquaticum]